MCLSRGEGNVGELLGRRVGNDGAVRKRVNFLRLGHDHLERAGHDLEARGKADHLDGCAQHVARGVHRARHAAIRLPLANHHGSPVKRISNHVASLLDGHPFVFAKIVELLGKCLRIRRSRRIDDFDPGQVDTGLAGQVPNFLRVPHQNRLHELALAQNRRSAKNTLFGPFRQNNGFTSRLRFFLNRFDETHGFPNLSLSLRSTTSGTKQLMFPPNCATSFTIVEFR